MGTPRRIGHIEIPAPDLEAAKAFYARVFGWTCEDVPGMDYAFWRGAEGQGGGLDPTQAPSDAGVNLVIEVEDIPSGLAAVEAAGGRTVKRKTRISDEHGFYATFLDPNGNRLSLWSRT